MKMVRNYKRKTIDRWSKQDLLDCLILIKDDGLKLKDASRKYGISRATLYRHYDKFIASGARYELTQFKSSGGNPILTRVEEEVLTNIVINLRAAGHTVTSTDVKRICYEYCITNCVPNQFDYEKRTASDDWYYGFIKRHPEAKKVGDSKSDTKSVDGEINKDDKSADHVPLPEIMLLSKDYQKNPATLANTMCEHKRQLSEAPAAGAGGKCKRQKLVKGDEEEGAQTEDDESQKMEDMKTELKGIVSTAVGEGAKVDATKKNESEDAETDEEDEGEDDEEMYDDGEIGEDDALEEEEDLEEEEEYDEEEGEEEEMGEEEEELGEEEEQEEEEMETDDEESEQME